MAAAVREHPGTQLEAIIPGCLSGFTDDDITLLANRLVDGVVAWGDVESVASLSGIERNLLPYWLSRYPDHPLAEVAAVSMADAAKVEDPEGSALLNWFADGALTNLQGSFIPFPTLLGRALRLPVMLAPVGSIETFSAGGGATAGQAAAEFGTVADRSKWRLVGPMHLAESKEQAIRDVRHGLDAFCEYTQHTIAAPHFRAKLDVLGHVAQQHAAFGQRPAGRPVRGLEAHDQDERPVQEPQLLDLGLRRVVLLTNEVALS